MKITRVDKKHIHINALFIQPTTYCALNCTDCYVKGWAAKWAPEGRHLSPATWFEIFSLFSGGQGKETAIYEEIDCHANQITFALDNIPETGEYVEIKRSAMLRSFYSFLDAANDAKYSGVDTEFHITTFSVENLRKVKDKLESIDVISLSHIHKNHFEEIKSLKKKYPDLVVNYNYQAEGSFAPVSEAVRIKEVLKIVDSMYFILHKPATGHRVNQKSIETFQHFWSYLHRALPPEARTKMVKDGCVVDAAKYSKTTKGCSSNISRFQIWPNGSVTGCPYKQSPTTEGALREGPRHEIVLSILNNIREAREVYEFNRCKIPEDFFPQSPIVARNRRKTLILVD